MIKVLLVDDHDLVRVGIGRLLDDARGIIVVGEASNGEDAVTVARDKIPNVVLMDVKMPGIGGLEAARRIGKYCPDCKIIALSTHIDEPVPSRFLQAGASGYLTKGAGVDEMVRAIRMVHSGKRYLSPEIAQQLALRAVGDDETPFSVLSEREMQVLLMLVAGNKVQDISDSLCLSPKTVNSYRYRLFEKLGVHNDVELVRLAFRHKLIDHDDL